MSETLSLTPFDDGIDPHVASFAVYVEDVLLAAEVTESIVSISYEETLDMADKCSILLINDDHLFTDATIFQPGNHLDVWMGYGGTMDFIGRTRITRHLPTFPAHDVPVLEIIGYGPEAWLGHQELAVTGGPKPRHHKKQNDADKRKRAGTIASIVTSIFEEHGIVPDLSGLDPKIAGHVLAPFDQKRGTTDLELVQTLANLFGCELKIEWRVPTPTGSYTVPGMLHKRRTTSGIVAKTYGVWTGIFRTPPRERSQRFFTFVWKRSDSTRSTEQAEDGSILSTNLEWGFQEQVSEIEVMYFDAAAFEWKHLTIAEDEARTSPLYKTTMEQRTIPASTYAALRTAKNLRKGQKLSVVDQSELDRFGPPSNKDLIHGGANKEIKVLTGRKKVRGSLPGLLASGGPALTTWNPDADGEIKNVTPLKIAASGYSVEVIPNRQFTNAADALQWASEWFRRKKDRFLSGDFEIVGNSLVRAGSVHEFQGLGTRYSGDWYCPVVTHRIDTSSSYITKIAARKIVL